MNLLSMIKNNYLRMKEKKNYMIIMLVITILMIILAIFISSTTVIKGNVAVISRIKPSIELNSNQLNITYLKATPKLSELVMNRYDAVVYYNGEGKYRIDSIKNENFERMILNELTNKESDSDNSKSERGVGTNILGYLIMIILLQGATYMELFAEDREKGTLRRILTSPVSVVKYLTANIIMNFSMIFVPTFLVISICKGVFALNVGFGYGEYAVLLSIITILSSSFALFMGSMIETVDNSVMATSSIVVITSILAGGFGNIGSNKIFSTIINVLPQRNFLTLVQAMEHGQELKNYIPEISYLSVACLIFVLVGTLVTKKKYS